MLDNLTKEEKEQFDKEYLDWLKHREEKDYIQKE